MLQPFYEIDLIDEKNNRYDLLQVLNISSFKFEENTEGSNTLELQGSVKTAEALNSKWLLRGNQIEFFYGMRGEGEYATQSPKRFSKITDIKRSYGNNISITIIAKDLGMVMKKIKGQKVYENIKASEIVSQFVSKYGMQSEIDETTFTYTNISQGNRTDFDFLQYLALQSNRLFYINDNKLFFIKSDKKKKLESKITFYYKNNNFETPLISLRINENYTQSQGQAQGVSIKSGESSKEVKKNSNDIKLGKYDNVVAYDNFANENQSKSVRKTQVQSKAEAGNFIPNNIDSSKDELTTNIAESKVRNAKDNLITADCETLLLPNLHIKDIITLAGELATADIGNYEIKKKTDTITGSNARTSFNLVKNATTAPTSIKAQKTTENTNTTVGKEKQIGNVKAKVVEYNNNGVRRN